ncbi:hypothetical protein [Kitasatospora sp. MAP5-34]|uniref:hypothetical protein n=1 Tax=Kitasatospora sp. MAP5-34 TaxID=3035102 RepID=UPI0024733AB6|nr:hypothetical protein [Kitasatospora sp. MAP5-34]MDH6578447.1 hypothetical protein [Kitasatospora sp. MAP5-34]
MESVSDEQLLPDEKLLWTGRPGRVPPGADRRTGIVVLLVVPVVVALMVLTVLIGHGTSWTAKAARGLLLLAGAANFVRVACHLVWTLPAARRLEVYRITDRRVLVTGTTGTASWWLDGLAEPFLNGRDLLFKAPSHRSPFELVASRFRPGVDGGRCPELRALPDAERAWQVAAEARRAMLDGVVRPHRTDVHRGELPPAVELAAGEQVLWTGRPARVRWWYGSADLLDSGYGVLFVVMSLLFAAQGPAVLSIGAGGVGTTLGLGQAVGSVLLRRARVTRSVYVLTNRRLIATWHVGRTRLVEARLTALRPPAVLDGDLVTEPAAPGPAARGFGVIGWPLAYDGTPALIGLADPREALLAVTAAQLAYRAPLPGPRQPQPVPEDDAWSRWD